MKETNQEKQSTDYGELEQKVLFNLNCSFDSITTYKIFHRYLELYEKKHPRSYDLSLDIVMLRNYKEYMLRRTRVFSRYANIYFSKIRKE